MSANKVAMQEVFALPSNGKFAQVPKEITLRAMSLLDEKKRLASVGLRGLLDLVTGCIVAPENVDALNMPAFDVDFCLIMLRILSHGPQYSVSVTCPHCGKTIDTQIDLGTIESMMAPDDFSAQFEIGPLPMSGDVITAKLLTYAEVLAMREEADKILAKFPQYKGDPADVLEYIYKIQKINGEEKPYVEKKAYIEQLTAADSIYLDEAYADAEGAYGPNKLVSFICDSCHNTFEKQLPMNEEFFRPKYYTAKR